MSGVTAVETTPARFPAVFMTPPAAPECGQAASVTVDQNGPSELMSSPTARERQRIAVRGSAARAPRKSAAALSVSRPKAKARRA